VDLELVNKLRDELADAALLVCRWQMEWAPLPVHKNAVLRILASKRYPTAGARRRWWPLGGGADPPPAASVLARLAQPAYQKPWWMHRGGRLVSFRNRRPRAMRGRWRREPLLLA